MHQFLYDTLWQSQENCLYLHLNTGSIFKFAVGFLDTTK